MDRKGPGSLVLALVLCVLIGAVVVQAATVASPTNFHGQEIQKIIDHLRSIGLNATADNIALFLGNGKIIVKPLEGGVLGENNEFGGPVYVDPTTFDPPPDGWDPTNPVDVDWMMSLAITLVHEKYHSEHHGVWDRISGNGKGAVGLGNPMEADAWGAALDFLDKVINKTLERADEPGISDEERARLLKLARFLLNNKLTRLSDYDGNGYGPPLWNGTDLERIRDDVDEARERLENASLKTSLGSIREAHARFDMDARERYDAFMLDYDKMVEEDTQGYARGMVGIVAAVEERPLEEPMGLHLVLELDIPGDLGQGPETFLLEYPGLEGDVWVNHLREGDEVAAEYSLSIAQTVVGEIISSLDPDAKARELYGQGLFTVTEGGPVPGTGAETVLIVVGAGSKAADSIAAAEIGMYLGSQGFSVEAVLDSEVSAGDLATHRVIVVGGPSVNSLAREFAVTKWDFCEDTELPCENPFSVIRVFGDAFAPGQDAVLVGGWEAEHTRMAGRVFRDAERYEDELADNFAVIHGSIHDPAGVTVRSAIAALEG